jgi:hypothetical protein
MAVSLVKLTFSPRSRWHRIEAYLPKTVVVIELHRPRTDSISDLSEPMVRRLSGAAALLLPTTGLGTRS